MKKRWQSCNKVILDFEKPSAIPDYCPYCDDNIIQGIWMRICNNCRYSIEIRIGVFSIFCFRYNKWEVRPFNNQLRATKLDNLFDFNSNLEKIISPNQQMEISQILNNLDLYQKLLK